ncbi:hypothetical protein BM1_10861 [Bipolaris maydis]|nr:hypothetical protein BM1_10861 [Bipolaris maydis]
MGTAAPNGDISDEDEGRADGVPHRRRSALLVISPAFDKRGTMNGTKLDWLHPACEELGVMQEHSNNTRINILDELLEEDSILRDPKQT